uniref:Citrate synthase n=1 Tax=Mycena chlorophos TaxID=658473 RepID=A0ABQ0MBJ9_MYCCL|nr:peroxysomal citrate synthase [Mycena chlorophos]
MSKPTASSLSVRDNRTGKDYTIPIVDNAVRAVDFKAIKAPRLSGEREENETEKGLRVSDQGFLNTAVLHSQITYIDGDAGVLRYRGYPIEQLALHSSHLETAYLLIYGSLPTESQFEIFSNEVSQHAVMHAEAQQFFRSFRYDAHPMAVLTSAFAYLGSYYQEANPSLQGQTLFTKGDAPSLAIMDKQIYRLIGKATTLAAMAYRVRQGREFVTPPTGMSYTASFLYQMDYLGQEDYAPNPVLVKALDVLFLLHADHEMNASASSTLQVGSSLVDPFSAIAAGCASLYGPLHGGANEAVVRMLLSIGKPENVPAFIEAVKRREKVLSGFGHRIYKTSDPRSFIVRKTADEVFKITGKDALLETAMALHDAAMKDEYFVSRKLGTLGLIFDQGMRLKCVLELPTWTFGGIFSLVVSALGSDNALSGLIYRAMGFPMDYFPVLFVIPRVVGWLAHWRQMMLQTGGVKIWRPRQIYVGAGKRDYVPIGKRETVEGLRLTPSAVEHSGISKRTRLATYKGKL